MSWTLRQSAGFLKDGKKMMDSSCSIFSNKILTELTRFHIQHLIRLLLEQETIKFYTKFPKYSNESNNLYLYEIDFYIKYSRCR